MSDSKPSAPPAFAPPAFVPPVWRQPDGQALSCRDKIKVLNENLEELRQMAQDALEDGLVLGADETQLRQTLHALGHTR